MVGGGNSGFQEGLFLTKFASSVTILERSDQLRASQALQDKVAGRPDMQVFTRTTVEEFRGNAKLSSILVKDLATNQSRELRPGAVFVFIGLLPNTDFLKEVVQLDDLGFIVTNANLETNLEGVFAGGDCRSGSTRQIASAVGEGATVALMVREYLERRGDKARPPDPTPA